MPDDAELMAIKDRAAEWLLAIAGVTAVGVGGRERAGRPTGEVVLKVFVAQKRPLDEIPPAELIPAEVEGVPTDVVVMGPAQLLQGPAAPPGRPEVPVADIDQSRHRPLVGGSATQADLTGALVGTIGCFLTHRTDPRKIYALSNFHIYGRAGAGPATSTVDTTRIGQPLAEDSATKCCSSMIGTYAGGAYDTTRDVGLARLDAGTEWKATILEIGVVAGTHTVTVTEAATLTYPVRKRGARSGLTGGTVQAIGVSTATQLGTIASTIVVRPNPDPAQPAGTQLYFAQEGDSGSVLVNNANQVVGLVFAKSTTGQGRAVPIDVVLSRFQAVESLPLDVATATDTSTVNTVPGSAMVAVPPELVPVLVDDPAPVSAAARSAPARSGAPSAARPGPASLQVPASQPWLPGVPRPGPRDLRRLQDDLDRSAAGRTLITFWLRHQRELTELVQQNRRVAVAWHRNGGPALLQSLVRMLGHPGLALPATVHGRSLSDSLNRIAAAFTRFGSAALCADLGPARAAVPDLGGLTYPQIVRAFDAR